MMLLRCPLVRALNPCIPMNLSLCIPLSPGDRVHHPGKGSGAPQGLSQGDLRHDAGLLAEGAPTAAKH